MNDQNDPIAELLRLAGPPSPIPAEREERVRAAAFQAWRGEVRRRTTVRTAWTLALAAGIAALALLAPRFLVRSRPPAPVPIASAERVDGSVLLRGAPLAAGMALHAGETLASLDGGRGSLALHDGTTLRFEPSTTLRFLAAGRFQLLRGAIAVDTHRDGGGTLAIGTRWGTVRDIGTVFEVRVSETELQVKVERGAVAVDRERAEAGTELRVSERGVTRTSRFEIEGRTLHAFLAWAAKEKGLPLRFAGADAERKAKATLLHGSIAGLGVDEALAAVLPTTGLTATPDAGRLLARSRP